MSRNKRSELKSELLAHLNKSIEISEALMEILYPESKRACGFSHTNQHTQARIAEYRFINKRVIAMKELQYAITSESQRKPKLHTQPYLCCQELPPITLDEKVGPMRVWCNKDSVKKAGSKYYCADHYPGS